MAMRSLDTTPAPSLKYRFAPAFNVRLLRNVKVPVALVPYHDWAERGPSTMRIWIPAG